MACSGCGHRDHGGEPCRERVPYTGPSYIPWRERVGGDPCGCTGPKPVAATPAAERCTVPPPGWRCSRAPGHEGPCAARPILTGDRLDEIRRCAAELVPAIGAYHAAVGTPRAHVALTRVENAVAEMRTALDGLA